MTPPTKRDFIDVTEMIRSIQRTEGNLDCFRRAQGDCDRADCAWRSYCLDEPEQASENQIDSGDDNRGFSRHNERPRNSGNKRGRRPWTE
jgi:hypothetical protein